MTRRLKSADPARLRILEIGDHGIFKAVYPQNTTWLSTWPKETRSDQPVFGLLRWRSIRKELGDGGFDLIVCYTQLYAPADPRSFGRAFVVGFPRLISPILRTFGVDAARRTGDAPLVALDYDDSFAVNRHHFRMLDRCTLYFKRELPVDGWQIFFKTGHRNLPTKRIRKDPRFQARLEKLRPISLGVPFNVSRMPPPNAEKRQDLFFAGQTNFNSTVRQAGLRQLEALAAKGLRIDIPREPVPIERYVERCASAWLAWSPEGLGWDCMRHYEAPYCGSVPVMSRASIQRHRPLLEGEHGFYYDVEGDHLSRTIVRALADKDRLRAIATAARAHVLAHHTWRALCDYVVAETYAASNR